MNKLTLLLIIPIVFSCSKSTKYTDEYELIENWLKIPEDYVFGNPTGVALKSNENLVVFHRGSRSWQVPMPKDVFGAAICNGLAWRRTDTSTH